MRSDAGLLQSFLARMGPAYARRHGETEAAFHLDLARDLSAERPARVRVREAPEGRLDVTVVGLDFFAEFALLCGTLSARGLDIEAGHVHTSTRATPAPTAKARPRRRPPGTPADGLPARLIVDEFRVLRREATEEPERLQELLESDVAESLALVARGRGPEARMRLDRRVAERFARAEPPAGALLPLEISFDNAQDAHWTLMEVRGPDTPGFLYALATGLALRDVYVQEVEIGSVGKEARDRFLIASRDGRKIEDAEELAALRTAVALLKQFAHLLPFAPDPALALRPFSELVERLLGDHGETAALASLASPEGLRQLARLFGASAFLWEDFLRLQSEHLLPVLGSWRRRPLRGRSELAAELRSRLAAAGDFERQRRALNETKDEEMLLADMKHLLDPQVDLARFSEAITDLADAVVETALTACRAHVAGVHGELRDEAGRPCPLAVLGLGKFGGREMGYASDIELVFVYGGPARSETGLEAGRFCEELVRAFCDFIAARQDGIFHVDLRLRPYGAKGPLASPLAALAEYYAPGGGAAAFERQALIKLRAVAGDATLGSDVLGLRDAFVWGEAPWDRTNALHLRERQARELVPAGRFHVKYSPGALVEVEYAVQYLQLEHGRDRPALRAPSTLVALERLRAADLVSVEEHARLRDAYLFWRAVADALRMVRGNARDLLLPEKGAEETRFLARRLGYSSEPGWQAAASAFQDDVARHRQAVSRFFARFTG